MPEFETEPEVVEEISAEETAVKQSALAQLDLFRRVQRARSQSVDDRRDLAFDAADEVLSALIDNGEATEEELTVIVRRRDVNVEILRRLAGDKRLLDSHRLRRMLVLNPKLPASAGLRLVSGLFLFDLVTVLITPAIPMEVKTAAENAILQQYQGIPLGQKITLARRAAGGRLLPMLLNDASGEVVRAALNNPFLTENVVSTAVWKTGHQHVIGIIAESPRWVTRRNVKLALLRNRMLTIGKAVTIVNALTSSELRELSLDSTVPMQVRSLIQQQMKKTRPLG